MQEEEFEQLVSTQDYKNLKALQETTGRELRMMIKRNKEMNMEILKHAQESSQLTRKLAKKEEHIKYLSKQIIILSQKLLGFDQEIFSQRNKAAVREQDMAKKFVKAAKENQTAKMLLQSKLLQIEEFKKRVEVAQNSYKQEKTQVVAIEGKNEETLANLRKIVDDSEKQQIELKQQKQELFQMSQMHTEQKAEFLLEKEELAFVIVSLEQKNDERLQQGTELTAKIGRMEEQRIQLEQSRDQLLSQKQEEISSKVADLENAITTISRLEQELASARQQESALSNRIEQFEKKHLDLQYKLDIVSKQLEDKVQESTAILLGIDEKEKLSDQERGSLISDIERLQKKLDGQKEELAQVQSENIMLKKNIEEFNQKQSEWNTNQEKHVQEFSKFESELETRTNSVALLQEQNQSLKKEIDHLKSTLIIKDQQFGQQKKKYTDWQSNSSQLSQAKASIALLESLAKQREEEHQKLKDRMHKTRGELLLIEQQLFDEKEKGSQIRNSKIQGEIISKLKKEMVALREEATTREQLQKQYNKIIEDLNQKLSLKKEEIKELPEQRKELPGNQREISLHDFISLLEKYFFELLMKLHKLGDFSKQQMNQMMNEEENLVNKLVNDAHETANLNFKGFSLLKNDSAPVDVKKNRMAIQKK